MTLHLIDRATECLQMGWSVFPLVQGGKVPMTRHGFKDASRSSEDVAKWWRRSPQSNIGVATGMVSGIVVVDIDVKKSARGKESFGLIKGLFPKTLTVRTPSGGWHLYYSYAKPLKSKNGFMNGIDVKADGGYVVGPGSVVNGKPYFVLGICKTLSELPDHLAAQFSRRPVIPVALNRQRRHVEGEISVSVRDGDWHLPILRAVASMVSRGMDDETILSKMDGHTLPGWTTEQTRREVMLMICGARRKGFDRHGTL